MSLNMILLRLTASCMIPAGSTQFAITQVCLERFGQAIEKYRADCGAYPDSLLGLKALVIDPGAKGWNGPYLKEPLADAWGRPYLYNISKGVPTVRSLGADGKSGGDLFDADLSSQNPFAPLRESRFHAAQRFFGVQVEPWLLLAASTYALLRTPSIA